MMKSWSQGIDAEALKDLMGNFIASRIMRKRLRQLLMAKQEESWNASMGKDAYTNPNWAYAQADARGYERALKDVLALLED